MTQIFRTKIRTSCSRWQLLLQFAKHLVQRKFLATWSTNICGDCREAKSRAVGRRPISWSSLYKAYAVKATYYTRLWVFSEEWIDNRMHARTQQLKPISRTIEACGKTTVLFIFFPRTPKSRLQCTHPDSKTFQMNGLQPKGVWWNGVW